MAMSKRKRALTAFAVFDILLLAVIVGIFLVRNSTGPTSDELSEMGVAILPDQPALSDFQLTDHNGNSFSKQDLAGKWNLLFFGFTSCPDVCPLTMNALKLFYNDLENTDYADDTRVIMVSVDPQRDTVEAMANYVQRYHQEFVGLTGEHEVITTLAKELYIAFSKVPEHDGNHDTENYQVQHSGYIAIVNPEGGYFSVMREPHSRESLTRAYFAVRQIEGSIE